jgi:hypothetical protein
VIQRCALPVYNNNASFHCLQVYLTIDLQEAKQPQISLDNDDAGGKVTFRSAAQSHATGQEDHDYALDVSRCKRHEHLCNHST